jgi:tetratricopeptide (TPR) repeat protein
MEREAENLDYKAAALYCALNLAERLRHSSRNQESQAVLQRSQKICAAALAIASRQHAAAPMDQGGRRAEIFWKLRLADCEDQLNHPAAAIAVLRRPTDLGGELLRAIPADVESHNLAGWSCAELGRLLRKTSPMESRALAQRACEEFEVVLHAEPSEMTSLEALGGAVYLLASIEDQADQTEQALRDFRRSAEIEERVYRQRPFNRRYWEGKAVKQHCIARTLVDLGWPAEALEPFRNAIEHREALVRLSPEDVKWRCDLNGSWMRLGDALEALGRTTEAVAAHRAAIAHQRQVCAREPGEINHRKCLDDQLRHLAWLLLALDRPGEAIEIACERVARLGHHPAVIFSATGELAMATLLIRSEATPH